MGAYRRGGYQSYDHHLHHSLCRQAGAPRLRIRSTAVSAAAAITSGAMAAGHNHRATPCQPLSRRGRSLPASVGGVDTHRDSMTSHVRATHTPAITHGVGTAARTDRPDPSTDGRSSTGSISCSAILCVPGSTCHRWSPDSGAVAVVMAPQQDGISRVRARQHLRGMCFFLEWVDS
jgi:hypothetical protein